MLRIAASKLIRPTACIAVLVGSDLVYCDATSTRKKYSPTPLSPNHDTVVAVAQRLKVGLAEDHLKATETTKDGVKIFYPKGGKFGASNGLMIARVAETEIKSNIDEIISMWCGQSLRKEWDTTCSSSQIIKLNEDGSILAQRVEKPVGLLIPPRDYACEIHRSPGGIVGINDFTAVLFVNIDAGHEVPQSWVAKVRGTENSILLLKPHGEHSTHVTLCIERYPGGWAWMSPAIANLVAGNNPAKLLASMKKALENEDDDIPAGLSVEEEARLRFKKKQAQLEKQKQGGTILDDFYAHKDDLEVTLKLLEDKLKRLKQTEVTEKIDLSVLRRRVEEDIKKNKAHLRTLK